MHRYDRVHWGVTPGKQDIAYLLCNPAGLSGGVCSVPNGDQYKRLGSIPRRTAVSRLQSEISFPIIGSLLLYGPLFTQEKGKRRLFVNVRVSFVE